MSELSWVTVESETDYTCPGFTVTRDQVRLPDGREQQFHYVDEAESVVVIPLTPEEDVVVIEEWRQAVERVSLSFPAGNVEPDDENLETAARRELREESGYVADELEYLAPAEPANGFTNAVHHYFVARGCTAVADQELDHNESIRPSTMSFPELRNRLHDGTLRDGRTALGLCYFDLLAEE